MSDQLFPPSTLSDRQIGCIVADRHARPAGRRSAAAIIALWLARSRQRRHLSELADWDDHLLRDIGVSREAALLEAAKPFWHR